VAHAVLTVRDGPRKRYFTFRLAQGMFVKICSMLKRFIVLYEVDDDYYICYSSVLLLEAMLPIHMPHRLRSKDDNSTLLWVRAYYVAQCKKLFIRLFACFINDVLLGLSIFCNQNFWLRQHWKACHFWIQDHWDNFVYRILHELS
jgi:hypothetical protein